MDSKMAPSATTHNICMQTKKVRLLPPFQQLTNLVLSSAALDPSFILAVHKRLFHKLNPQGAKAAVLDPKLSCSSPDLTFQVVPDPDPTF
jgi:hypothetical protein